MLIQEQRRYLYNKIVIPLNICTRIDEISSTHCNYYKLPEGMSVKGYDVICEICSPHFKSYKYILGIEKEGKFKDDGTRPKFYSSFDYK